MDERRADLVVGLLGRQLFMRAVAATDDKLRAVAGAAIRLAPGHEQGDRANRRA